MMVYVTVLVEGVRKEGRRRNDCVKVDDGIFEFVNGMMQPNRI